MTRLTCVRTPLLLFALLSFTSRIDVVFGQTNPPPPPGPGRLELVEVRVAERLPRSPGIDSNHEVVQSGNSYTITINTVNNSLNFVGQGQAKVTLGLPDPAFTTYIATDTSITLNPLTNLQISGTTTGTGMGTTATIRTGLGLPAVSSNSNCHTNTLLPSNSTSSATCRLGTADVVVRNGRRLLQVWTFVNFGGLRDVYSYYAFEPAPPKAPSVTITGTNPKLTAPIWPRPASMPDITASVEYTAPADGEIGIELRDHKGELLNVGDRTVRVAQGQGTADFRLSRIDWQTYDVQALVLEAILLTADSTGKLTVTTRSPKAALNLVKAPQILAEIGCADHSRPGIPFRRFDQDDYEDGGAGHLRCPPGVLADLRFDGTAIRLSAEVSHYWGDELRSASRFLPPRLVLPADNLQVLSIYPEIGQGYLNADRFQVKIVIRNEETQQFMRAPDVTVPVEAVQVLRCEPQSVVDWNNPEAACLVQYSTWGRPRDLRRSVKGRWETIRVVGTGQKGAIPDSFVLRTKEGVFASQPSVAYALFPPNGDDARMVSSLGGYRFLRVASNLDEAVSVVGRDKVSEFISGKLTFLNGLGLTGKLGTLVRTASDACSGASQGGARAFGTQLLADAVMTLSKKRTDCLTKLQEAYRRIVDPKAVLPSAAAAGDAQFLPLATSWFFDTKTPKGSGFAANLTLSYEGLELPDHPDFQESKIVLISYDPDTLEFEILPASLDAAARTATATIDHLAPIYSLAVIEPAKHSILRSPVLTSGPSLYEVPDRTSQVALNNGDPAGSSSFVISGFDSSGVKATAAGPVAAPPGKQASASAREVFGTTQADWAEFSTESAKATGVHVIRGAGQLELLPLERETGNGWILSRIEENEALHTEIHIANTAKTEAAVTCDLRDSAGVSVGTWSGDIPGKGKISLSLAGMFPSLRQPFRGYVSITSSQEITAAALLSSIGTGLESSVGKLAPSGAENGRYFASLAGGTGITARLTLTNFDGKPAPVVIRGYLANGTSLPAVTITIGALEQYSATFDEVFGIANAPPGTPVAVRVESLQDTLLGDVTLTSSAGSIASVPLRTGPASELTIPYVSGENNTVSTLYLSNPASREATVTVTQYPGAAAGSPAGPVSVNVTLAANSSGSRTVSSLFGASATRTTGFLTLRATQPITAMVVVDPGSGGDFAALSAITTPGTETPGTPAAPTLTVSPTTLDFSQVATGQRRDLTLTIRNTGTALLSVNALSLSNPVYTLVSPPSMPFQVAGGAEQALTVRFAPAAAGAQNGNLTIASNDPARNSVAVPLSGSGIVGQANTPSIEVTAGQLDFGSVTAGQNSQRTVTVRNVGTGILQVTAVSSSNLFSPSPFTFSVAAGASQSVTVTFRPDAAGARTANLTITSNDAARPSITVAMTGIGVAAPVAGACGITTNFARNAEASQSSVAFDGPASLGNNGVIEEPNGYGFHTALEDRPWWQVDLGGIKTICEIRLFNRLDAYWDRAKTVRVLFSNDGSVFETAYSHDGTTWGTSGTPLNITSQVINRRARYVRVQLNEREYLHLREVEVYGASEGSTSGPVLSLASPSVDFGSVTVGSSSTRTFAITNAGTAPLNVTSITTTAPFSVSPASISSLAPGSTMAVTLAFAPTAAGALTRSLTLLSNDSSRPSMNVTLSGTGTTAPVAGACGSTTNFARTGEASQSSTGFGGEPQLGNNGVINEPSGYGFHTALEDKPWWQVDLGSVKTICEIRLFNRADSYWERAKTIRVLFSNDGSVFETAYSHDGTTWGTTGSPLAITNQVINRRARFVRVQLNEREYLHLREVEVYGASTP